MPSSFNGSPISLKQNFLDSMTIVQKYGKPKLFITITCNPKWQEISQNLGDFKTAIDRPDIVAKVFNQEVEILLEDGNKKGIFGKCIAYTYVIEFQNRSLPHMHMLLFIDKDNKVSNADCVDTIISAEILDEVSNLSTIQDYLV